MSELERLAQSYDSTDVALFRWGGDSRRAVVVVDSQLLVLVVCGGSDSPQLPAFPHRETVDGWLRSDPRAIASCALGRLLVWASKRPPRNELAPGDDDAMFSMVRSAYDFQRVHDTPFNRRLIREALQTLVELDYDADIRALLEMVSDHRGNPQLRITVGDLTIYVMGCTQAAECGDDPMPVDWEAV